MMHNCAKGITCGHQDHKHLSFWLNDFWHDFLLLTHSFCNFTIPIRTLTESVWRDRVFLVLGEMINSINLLGYKLIFSRNDIINTDSTVHTKRMKSTRELRMIRNCCIAYISIFSIRKHHASGGEEKENPITLIHDDISYGSWHCRNLFIFHTHFFASSFACSEWKRERDSVVINYLLIDCCCCRRFAVQLHLYRPHICVCKRHAT